MKEEWKKRRDFIYMWLSKYVKRKLKHTNDLSVAAIPSCTREREEPYRVNVVRFLCIRI
jgi:hypothetical protein